MKQPQRILLVTLLTMMLSANAYANVGPAIAIQFSLHLVVLTWLIGIGEGILLCMLFRAWTYVSRMYRIFIAMIAANIVSAWLGMQFVNSRHATLIMGDVTLETLQSVFWTMVYVSFVLTMIIEFPFFLVALYGRKWLIPKALAATLLAHCIGYTLLFNFYRGEESMKMVTTLEVVPASTFEMKEDYVLYYISPDGKNVLRSDLAGNHTEVVATLDMDGFPDRLCAGPRKVIKESRKEADKWYQNRVCWESGFDLFVLMRGKDENILLMENFSPSAAVVISNGEYQERCDVETVMDCGEFRSFGNAENWEFESDYWALLTVRRIKQGYEPYSSYSQDKFVSSVNYIVHTPFVQWRVRNGSHIAGDYGVFKLGEDQICIMDPERKRIALIARGFGPVVAKPSLVATQEEIEEPSSNSLVGSHFQQSE